MATANILSKMEYANDTADANKLQAIYDANPSLFGLPADAVDANAQNCSTSSAVNFLYLPTIRGGRKMNGSSGNDGEAFIGGCGCGMKGGNDGNDAYTGGCFTCPKGTKEISIIYGTIHVVIPSLYKKYKNAKNAKSAKRKAKSAKPVANKAKTRA
jgi:hypothetical protein